MTPIQNDLFEEQEIFAEWCDLYLEALEAGQKIDFLKRYIQSKGYPYELPKEVEPQRLEEIFHKDSVKDALQEC